MASIDIIRVKIREGTFEFTIPHFFEEMAEDDLAFADIERVILEGRVRRRFTDDPRGPRFEVVGPTVDGREAAVVCRIKATGAVLLITTYLIS